MGTTPSIREQNEGDVFYRPARIVLLHNILYPTALVILIPYSNFQSARWKFSIIYCFQIKLNNNNAIDSMGSVVTLAGTLYQLIKILKIYFSQIGLKSNRLLTLRSNAFLLLMFNTYQVLIRCQITSIMSISCNSEKCGYREFEKRIGVL